MTLEFVKQAIKVDFPDDDDYIQLLIDSAKEYITDGVAPYDSTIARHRLLLIALVDAAYKERSYTVKDSKKAGYIVRSMAAQLRDGW